MQNYWNFYLACKQQQLYGPVNYRDFRETGPRYPLLYEKTTDFGQRFPRWRIFRISPLRVLTSRSGIPITFRWTSGEERKASVRSPTLISIEFVIILYDFIPQAVPERRLVFLLAPKSLILPLTLIMLEIILLVVNGYFNWWRIPSTIHAKVCLESSLLEILELESLLWLHN